MKKIFYTIYLTICIFLTSINSYLFSQVPVTPTSGFTQAFQYSTPGEYFITIPAGVTQIQVKAWGAGGGRGANVGAGANFGGPGGYSRANFSVTPGQNFAIIVGTGGANDDSTPIVPNYGFGGTLPSSNCSGGQGGGLSGLFIDNITVSQSDRSRAWIIAGGGGGAGGFNPPLAWSRGGSGNYVDAIYGDTGDMAGITPNGQCLITEQPGGGGGYGGGVPHHRANGGNSEYDNENIYGCNGGTGYILPSATNQYSSFTPDWSYLTTNTSDPHYVANAGRGGSFVAPITSGNGLVIIQYGASTPCTTPSCSASGPGSGTTGTTYTFTAGSVIPSGSTVTWVANGGGLPASGTGSTANVSWSTAGAKTVTFTVTNSSSPSGCSPSASSTCAANINITSGGTPCTTPSCSASGPGSGTTGNTYTFTAGSIVPAGSTVTWVANGGGLPASGTGSTANVSWSTAGAKTVTFTVTNSSSPSGCSPSASSTCSANINITSGGTPTIFAKDDINQTQEGITVNGWLNTNDDNFGKVVSANQGGVNIPIGVATAITGGTITINDDGTYTFVPASGFTGKVPSINYTITDLTSSVYADADLYIDVIDNIVNPGNDNPTANHDTAIVEQGSIVSVGSLNNDSDLDGNSLTVTSVTYGGSPVSTNPLAPTTIIVGGVTAGTAYVDPANGVVFTASGTYLGDVPFSYTISDGLGGTDSSTINITIVAPTTFALYANDDANSAPQGVPMIGKVLPNDSFESAGSPSATPTFSVIAAKTQVGGTNYDVFAGATIPGVGYVKINPDGSYEFNPVSTYIGTLPIYYSIADDTGTVSDTAWLYLTSVESSSGGGACSKPYNMNPPTGFTPVGVSTLADERTGWPEDIQNGFIALESKNKGFIITRLQNSGVVAQPVEGMLIYDIDAACFKLYDGTKWSCISKCCDK